MLYEPEAGMHIGQAVLEAIELAKRSKEDVLLSFNEIELIVSSSSCARDIMTIYDLKGIIRRLKLGYKD